MIPSFADIGSPWEVLPPGIHEATMDEIEDRFAISEHRKNLFNGLKQGTDLLQTAGCRTIYLNGSFVTEKPFPKDYDACWDTSGVDISKVDPVFFDFSENRKKQKALYYGEFFPSSFSADGALSFFKYFQIDKHTGKTKGIRNLMLFKKNI